MTQTKLTGKGGAGRGQGRKRGSTRPEMRTGIMQAYEIVMEEIRDQAEREDRKCEPVTETYMVAYAVDHPDKVTVRKGKTIDDLTDAVILHEGETVRIREIVKVKDERHFKRYCAAQRQLRKTGKRDFEMPDD